MKKIKTLTFIEFFIVAILLTVALIQTKGYFLTAFESKYVTCSIFSDSFYDIVKSAVIGINVFENSPIYLLITKFFITVFGSPSEFTVRFPVLLISFLTTVFLYFFLKNYTDKKYAVITTLTFCLNISFLTFSSVSIPQIMAADFAMLAVLFGFVPLLPQDTPNKHLYFIGFWVITFMVIYTDLFTGIIPLLIVGLSYLILGKTKKLFNLINIILCVFSVFIIMYNWQLVSYKVAESIPIFDTLFIDGRLHIPSYIFLKYFTGLFIGLMPWSVLFLAITLISLFDGSLRQKFSIKDFTNDKRFLTVSFIGFFVATFVFFLNHSVTNIILAVSFASFYTAYFWHKYITEEKYKSVFVFSSSFFFSITVLLAISSVFIYFFFDNSIKGYIEPLLIPLIIITLSAAIPGLLVLMIDRRWYVFFAHLIFSLAFYFMLTGVLFDYLNSFGESELITYASDAKNSVKKLVTYDLKNKFVLPYYFGNIVEFNDKISPEEIFEKYGENYDVRVVAKVKSLEDFDRYFVYEILNTGKFYCVITNIKKLPPDYVKNNENEDNIQ